MDGKTAYEVSKEGYSKHLSQQWTWFTDWINGKNNNYTKATDIKTYSPLKYGLFYSRVGKDIEKNDMLENITYYEVQFQEEEKTLKKQEEEEKKQLESPKKEITETPKKNKNKTIFTISIMGILVIIILIISVKKYKKQKSVSNL